MSGFFSKFELFAALPPPWPQELRTQIRDSIARGSNQRLVVLDDDPTGTQTVYDVPVLTDWSTAALRAEFESGLPCFFVLTNSRSLTLERARDLNREIARNLKSAAGSHRFVVVSRSDSTLRGHFPIETDTLAEELGPFDATILIPYFEAGGRYTIDSVHYVAEGDALVPAAKTPFARDAAFGYRHSDLREWVAEKTGGRFQSVDVTAISLRTLRLGGPDAVAAELDAVPPGGVCVVDAAAPRDLDVFVVGLLAAERTGKRFLFRTAAQFVSARLGLEPRPLLIAADLDLSRAGDAGGLVMVGSYVPKTTEQLNELLRRPDLHTIELAVESLLKSDRGAELVSNATAQMNAALHQGQDVVVFTSRQLVTGTDAAACLDIGRRVSDALVTILQGLSVRPRYLVAKGGITSSELATRGLGVRRAMVAGQVLPGVPVWRLGDETNWPELPYVVFPGNVGGPDALAKVQEILSSRK